MFQDYGKLQKRQHLKIHGFIFVFTNYELKISRAISAS